MKTINGKQYMEKEKHSFDELQEIVGILRSPEGCPWDREQTHASLRKCLKDETEEVIQAIDNDDMQNLCEELGDLLLQVLLHSVIAREEGFFTFDDVVQTLSEKMIRRHPHVFGDAEGTGDISYTADLWKEIKKREKENAGREPV